MHLKSGGHKMYNQNNKTSNLNIVDIALVIIAIAIIILFTNFILMYSFGLSNINNSTITYVLKLDNIDNVSQDIINVKDSVYDTNGNEIGKIKRIEYTNYQGDFNTALVSVTANAKYDGTCYYINDKIITAGNIYTFRLSDYIADGLCVNVFSENTKKQ
jgi:hypothetical protein